MRVKVFICYSGKDEKTALVLTDCLEKSFGFEVFLAQESLKFSEDWLNDIWANLNECHIFIPLISSNLNLSAFANQEIGIALMRPVTKIVPISIDGENPEGFLSSRIQCHKYDKVGKDEILNFSTEIFFNIFNDQKRKYQTDYALDSIVYALGKSDSWKRTSIILNIIIKTNKLVKFKKKHLDEMVITSHNNPNVRNPDYLFPKLKNFLAKSYNIIIDK